MNDLVPAMFLLSAVFIGFASCKTLQEDNSKLRYAIMPNSKYFSVLKSIYEDGGKINVEIHYVNKASDSGIDQLKSDIKNAVETWNSALYGYKGWDKRNIQVNFISPETDCRPRLTSGNWMCAFNKNLKVIVDGNCKRSNATIDNRLIVLQSPLEREHQSKTVLHEYGHILGLGDTYSEKGYQTPEKSPPAIMNYFDTIDTLTEDDRAGIRAMWTWIVEGRQSLCLPGYKLDIARENRFGNIFCIPERDEQLAESSYSFGIGEDDNAAYLTLEDNTSITMKEKSFSMQTWKVEDFHENWKFISTMSSAGDKVCLNVNTDQSIDVKSCQSAGGQLWFMSRFVPHQNIWKIQSMYAGMKVCLDVGAKLNRIKLEPCQVTYSQMWNIAASI